MKSLSYALYITLFLCYYASSSPCSSVIMPVHHPVPLLLCQYITLFLCYYASRSPEEKAQQSTCETFQNFLLKNLKYMLFLSIAGPSVCPFSMPLQYAPSVCPFSMPLQYAPSVCPFSMPLQYAPSVCPFSMPLQYAPSVCPFSMPPVEDVPFPLELSTLHQPRICVHYSFLTWFCATLHISDIDHLFTLQLLPQNNYIPARWNCFVAKLHCWQHRYCHSHSQCHMASTDGCPAGQGAASSRPHPLRNQQRSIYTGGEQW